VRENTVEFLLQYLAAIGQFHLLQQLYQDLHIAEGVWQELNAYQPPLLAVKK